MDEALPNGVDAAHAAYEHLKQQAADADLLPTDWQALLVESLAQQQTLLLGFEQLRAAQVELAAVAARLHAAEEVAGIGSYELELVSGTLHFSAGMYRLFGEEPGSFIPSLTWVDARSYPEDIALVQQVLKQAAQDRRPYHYTRRIRRADGQWRQLESHGRVVCDATGQALRLEGVVEDITEQQRIQQALQASEAQFQLFVTASADVVYKMSADWQQMYQLAGKEFLADTRARTDSWLQAYIPAEDQPGVAAAIAQAIDTTSLFELEHRVFRADGTVGWVHSRAVPVLSPQGELLEWVGTASDITARKQAEQGLQASRELLQATIDSSQDLIQVFEAVRNEAGDIVDFRWVLLNPAAQQAFGPVIGQCLREHNPGVVDAGIFDTFRQVVETGRPDQQERHYTREQFDGWFYQSVVKLRDGVATTTADITARKQAEQHVLRLQAEVAQYTEDKYRALFNVLDEGVCVFELLYDAQGEPVDCQYLEVNPAFARQTGLTNVAGKRLSDFSSAVEAYWLRTHAQVVKTGEPLRFENHHARTGRWYEVYTTRVGGDGSRQLCAVFSDVTERKHREAALRASEARLQLALDAADLGTFAWYVAEDRTEADARALIHFGFAPDAAATLSESLARIFHPEDGPRYVEAIRRAIDPAGPGTLHQEFRIRRSDGERWMSVQAQTEFEGHPPAATRITGVLADITAHKHAEQRQQFLLHLSDVLRPLADPRAIQEAALQFAAEQLNLDRVLYNEIDPDVTTYTVRAIYVREGFAAYGGVQPMGPFTESVRALQQGVTKVVYDVETDDSFSPEERAICAGIQVRAFVVVPLLKNGRWVLNLVAHSSTPRPWPPHELHLLEQTAERTWATVERALAEQQVAADLQDTQLLQQLAARFVSEENVQTLYEEVLAVALRLTRADAGTVQIFDADAQELVLLATSGFGREATAYFQRVGAGSHTGCGQALHSGKRVFIDYDPTDADPACQLHVHAGYLSGQSTPLIARSGEQIGMLNTHWRTANHRPTERELRFLDLLARQAADLLERAQAEEALRHSEEQFRTVANLVPDLLWRSEPDSNTSWFNQRWLDYTGQTMEEAAGFGWSQAIHPDDRPESVQAYRAAVQQGRPLQREHRIRSAAGGYRWFLVTVLPARTEQGTITNWYGAATDIEAQKQAEAGLRTFAAALEAQVAERTHELQESRDLLQSVFDTSLIMLLVCHTVRNEQGAIEDFRIALSNQEAARKMGRGDLVGKHMGREFPGLLAAGLFELMQRTVDTDEPQHGEFYYSDEGFYTWYACMFVKLDDGLVATYLDITTRKRAEQQQLRSFALLQQAEAVAGLGSWSYELATGHLLVSDGMYQLLGLPPGSVVTPAIYGQLAVDEDRNRAEHFVQQVTAGMADGEDILRLRVGEQVKTVRLQAVVVRDAAGQPVQVLGVDLDISEVRRLEADNLQLRLSQQQALFEAVLEAQEAERKRISESLHNSLGQTLYATKLKLNELLTGPPSPALNQAEQLLAEAIRQTRTISHELVPTVLTEFGLGPALRDIGRHLSGAQLRVECTVELDEAEMLPLSLQVALYRIAQELLQNVVKHARATQASLALETVPGFVLLRVEDNGVGFLPEAAAPAGLGLRTIRSRVALLGGTLDMGSSPAYGTYVRLRIPLSPFATPLAP